MTAAFRILAATTGAVLAVMALAADALVGQPAGYETLRVVLGVIGGLLLLAALLPARHITPMRLKVVMLVAVTVWCFVLLDVGFRVAGHTFDARVHAFEAYPIYYREPTEPVGDVLFRRPGPDAWTGQVLATGYRMNGGTGDVYADEPEQTITYDADGFRNPEDLDDWDVVVVGDSFTELGYLAYEDLFTTHLGTALGLRVRNLGVSGTGTMSHATYLERYGKAASTRHAVLVFFEGNDIQETRRELDARAAFEADGTRPEREVRAHPSLILALCDVVASWFRKPKGEPNATVSIDGEARPVTIRYAPPGRDDLSPSQRTALTEGIAAFVRSAEDLGLTSWVVYAPSKHRVLHSQLTYTSAKPELASWTPSDLSAVLFEICARHHAGFVDVTPALIERSRSGEVLYNLVWDTHFSRAGSHVFAGLVAQEIGDRMR